MSRLVALLLLTGCGAAMNPQELCVAAGGTCRLGFCGDGGTRITSVDCNPSRNPGGGICCTQ